MFQQEKAAPAARTAREKAAFWAEETKASASARWDAAVEDSKAYVSEKASAALERIGFSEWADNVREQLGEVEYEVTPLEGISQWLDDLKDKLQGGESTLDDSPQGISASFEEKFDGAKQWFEEKLDGAKNQLGLVEEPEDEAPQGLPQWVEDLKQKLGGMTVSDPKAPANKR